MEFKSCRHFHTKAFVWLLKSLCISNGHIPEGRNSSSIPVADGCCWSLPPGGHLLNMEAHSLRASLHAVTLSEWKTPISFSTPTTFSLHSLSTCSPFAPLSSSSSTSAGPSILSSRPLCTSPAHHGPPVFLCWLVDPLAASVLWVASIIVLGRLSSSVLHLFIHMQILIHAELKNTTY